MLRGGCLKVLVLTDSTTSGVGLADRSLRWPLRLPAEIDRLTGEVCEVTETRFDALDERAPLIAAKAAEDADPDIVLLLPGTFGFRLQSIHAKIRRKFGRRAGAVARWIEKQSEGREGIAAAGPVRKRVYSAGRTVAHRVIGTAPLCTPDELLAIYSRTFSLLARREGVRVISLHYFRPVFLGGPAAEPNPVWQSQLEDTALAAATLEYNKRLHAEIESRHFERVFFGDRQDPGRESTGSLRLSPGRHSLFAEMVAEQITGKSLPAASPP